MQFKESFHNVFPRLDLDEEAIVIDVPALSFGIVVDLLSCTNSVFIIEVSVAATSKTFINVGGM